MAQTPTDQNFYHHHPHSHTHPQIQLPPQFRNPFDLFFDERASALNYNYMRPYIPNQLNKQDELPDSLVMRRPRRTRTTFTSSQIAELEQHFLQGRYLTSSRLSELSNKLSLGTAQVKIWFKNRRRRHKILSDKQKEHSSCISTVENMSISPSVSSTKSNGPPNTGVSTPTTLTPSPTPTSPPLNLNEHYGELYNNFYHNQASVKQPHSIVPQSHHATHSHHNTHSQAKTNIQHPHIEQYNTNTAVSVPQLFSTPSRVFHQSHNQHHNHLQQQSQHQQNVQHEFLHQNQSQQQFNNFHHQSHYECHQKNNTAEKLIFKEDSDLNLSHSYYMRMSAFASNGATVLSTNTGKMTPPLISTLVEGNMISKISPYSEGYESLTPNNDENPILSKNCGNTNNISCNVNSYNSAKIVDLVNGIDQLNTKSMQVVNSSTKHNDRSTHILGNVNNLISGNTMEGCTGAFTKYNKLANEINETNFQCTMDTIMHAYNNHRNTSSNTQFAYCFN